MRRWYRYVCQPWTRQHAERLALALARHSPRWLVYWSTIHLGAVVTQRPPLDTVPVPDITLMDALRAYREAA